jgi:hypothetical protein
MKEADVPLKKCHTAKTLHSRTQNMKWDFKIIYNLQ